MTDPYCPDPQYFERLPNQNGNRYYLCKVCPAQKPRRSHNCKSHENSRDHGLAIEAFLRRPPPSPPTPQLPRPVTDQVLSEDALRALLVSGSSDPTQPAYPPGSPFFPSGLDPYFPPSASGPRTPSPSPLTGIDWNLYDFEQAFQDGETLTPQEQYRQQVFQKTLDLLNQDISDYDAGMDADDGSSSDESFIFHDAAINNLPQKRARAGDAGPKVDPEWYPWPDRITWSLDVLMHLPRSVFSRKQLDLFLWLLRINRVEQVPTTKSMKTMNNILQNMCGVETLRFQGKFGHPYHVNSLSQILAQEMCNPKVRPHLKFYPEDTGKYVAETCQASNWLNEVSPDEATPMIRIHHDDYYIYEPTMLVDATYCVPFRWYVKDKKYWGHAWALQLHVGGNGWVVRKDIVVDLSEDELLKNFPRFSTDHKSYGVPHPSQILGFQSDQSSQELHRWMHTDPAVGNRWRRLAKGHRTVSVPLMTYCDDTSGNQSKKWNEHNSFLFTLAGLPREEVSKEYNIHFLCTSNLAPPLEMLDGVVEQIEGAKREGIWAWDCVYKEPILVVPTVPSMLGDNPMQSEFCCHIGSQGKYFCRMCMVKGLDVEESKSAPLGQHKTPNHSPMASVHSGSDKSTAEPCLSDTASLDGEDGQGSVAVRAKGKAREPRETMQAMVRRISDFIKIGIPRTKEKTKEILSSFLKDGKTLYSKTKLAKSRTETGVKDTYQQFFLDRLASSYKNKYGADKQRALNQAIEALPEDVTSPIWRLGLDPHSDTPVEILHVVLLGFVKYFWCDLVQNQINDSQKETLIARLNSLDVRGLGISQLGGTTLVTYAGSLTGRDFRAISQVAPFVIYDMVSPDVYDAWVALSTMVPLIWQPVIEDIDKFCETLETEIQNFLIKTVKWTCAWFNKSKFHILLHLPSHIRHFGPAILFATEAFESFNAVIRAKSTHSNRQAPSRDIALAFAQGNRVRHLMSGGLILSEDRIEQWLRDPHATPASAWNPVGPAAIRLMSLDPTPSHYLGLSRNICKPAGNCKTDKKPLRPWRETLTGKHLPQIFAQDALQVCLTNSEVTLYNEDVCSVGQYVIASRNSTPFIARVQEIVQVVGSQARHDGLPDGLLLQTAHPIPGTAPLPMPHLCLQDTWSFVELKDVLCTVNVQHHCQQHGCQTTGVRYVVQERSRSEQTVPVVQHLVCPDDVILNMAQMRDAIHLQKFRQASSRMDDTTVSAIVHESVQRAVDARKAVNLETAQLRGRGRGRGRGGVGRRATGRGGRGRGFVPLSPGESVMEFN